MKIALTMHQASHLQGRQQALAILQQRAQDAQEAMNAAVTTLALDGGISEGAVIEQFSVSKEGDQNWLTLVEKPKPSEG